MILIHEAKLAAMQPLVPLLEAVAHSGRPLLIIAEDVETEALATLIVNRVRGTLPSVAVKAPGFGDRRKEILGDIATLTSGRVISADLGNKLEYVKIEELGTCSRVVVDKDSTAMIGGGGDKRAIADRIERLRREIREVKSDYDKENLQERLAKLTGGVAVIRVGAATEADAKSRKEAFEDAVSATKAASPTSASRWAAAVPRSPSRHPISCSSMTTSRRLPCTPGRGTGPAVRFLR